MPSLVKEDPKRLQGLGEEADGEGPEAAVEGRRDFEDDPRLVPAAADFCGFSLMVHTDAQLHIAGSTDFF